MPQTRAERLAQRAAERRARVEQQATKVDDVGATAAAREQQQDDYKRELAQNRADRERRERAEAQQLRESEADFLQKFAPPPGLAAAAPSLRQQAVANAIANKPDPFAARRAQQQKAREAYEERKRELQRRVPTPPPPSPGPPPGPPPGQPSGGLADAFPPRGSGNRAPPPRGGGLEDAFPPRGGGLSDAFPPRGGGGGAPPPRGNPFERPPDPLRDPVGRRAGIDPLPQNPFEKPPDPLRDPPGRRAGIDPLPQMQPTAAAGRAAPVEHQIDPLRDAPPPRRDDPLRDTWGQAPRNDGREQRAQYAAQLRQQMAEKNNRRASTPPAAAPEPYQQARQPSSKADYAAELRAQMAADERRRDADRRDEVGGGFIGSANMSNNVKHDRQAAYAADLRAQMAADARRKGAQDRDRRDASPERHSGILGGSNLSNDARHDRQTAYAEALARDQALKREMAQDDANEGFIGGANLSSNQRHDRQQQYAEALKRDQAIKDRMAAPVDQNDGSGIIGGRNLDRDARNQRQQAYADALARDQANKLPERTQQQQAKSGTPPGWYVGPTGQLVRIDPRDHAGRNNAALAVGVPANYTPHKIDTLASPARGLDRTPHVRHTAGELQGYIGEPDRDQGKKQAMADMWKRQLEMDVAAKKRAKELEEQKEREDELREERRIERERAEMAAKHERERAVDEKLRQQEADRRQHAELLEQRRLQRERDEDERRRKDAEDDARVAREQREMLLKYEREQAAREPKIGVATAAQVVTSLQRLRSPPPPSSPPSPQLSFGAAGLAAAAAARAHQTPSPKLSFGAAGMLSAAAARAHKEETPVAPKMSFGAAAMASAAASRAHQTPASPKLSFGAAGMVSAAAARAHKTPQTAAPAPAVSPSPAPPKAPSPAPIRQRSPLLAPPKAPTPIRRKTPKKRLKLPDKHTDSMKGWVVPGRDAATLEGPPSSRWLPEAASRLERALEASRAPTPSTSRLDGQSQLVFPDGRVEDGGTTSPKPVRAHTPQAPCSTPVPHYKEDDVDAVLKRNQKRLIRAEALTEATTAALDASGFERGEAVDRLLQIANERPATPMKRVEASLPSDVRWATVAPSPRLEARASAARESWRSAGAAAKSVAAFAR
jgi:hypothetical protein